MAIMGNNRKQITKKNKNKYPLTSKDLISIAEYFAVWVHLPNSNSNSVSP